MSARLKFESLNGNPASKFEAAATRCAREDCWRTRRGSQSGPQARVRKFETLEFEFWKPREFESLKVRKVQRLKVRKVSIFGGLKA